MGTNSHRPTIKSQEPNIPPLPQALSSQALKGLIFSQKVAKIELYSWYVNSYSMTTAFFFAPWINRMRKSLLIREAANFVRCYPEWKSTETRWKRPLLGFAMAQDSLFYQIKKWVRSTHAMPRDLLPSAKSVISFFLPFENRIHRENAEEHFYASRSWAVAYIETNSLIRDLGEHLKAFLEKEGFRTVLTPATHNYEPEVLVSDWSHRHVAYVTGLGRLGLNNWLITDKGCCGRLGTLVTEAIFRPSVRPTREFCLARDGHACSACLSRCVYGALSRDGFDRFACNRQLLKNDAHFRDLQTTDVCGKCGCNLPCSVANPVAKLRSRARKMAKL